MNVYALTIRHPGARTTRTLHTTEEGAEGELTAFVENNWKSLLLNQDIDAFDDSADMVDHFFNVLREYKYTVEGEEVYGPTVAEETPLGPDEVLLTPEEVVVAFQAIGLARADEISHYTGIPRDKVIALRSSVYEKLKD